MINGIFPLELFFQIGEMLFLCYIIENGFVQKEFKSILFWYD